MSIKLTNQKTILPNVFVVGATRCGTTSLYQYLGEHPEIYKPPYKCAELFLTEKIDYKKARLLYNKSTDALRLDCSHYFHLESAAERIKSAVPDAKIIIGLRPAKELFLSSYIYRQNKGEIPKKLTFEEYTHTYMDKGKWYVVEHLKYDRNINFWISRFGKKNVLIFQFEELATDAPQLCKRIFKFLGVDNTFRPHIYQYNKRDSNIPRTRWLNNFVKRLPLSWRLRVKEMFPILEKIYSEVIYSKMEKAE